MTDGDVDVIASRRVIGLTAHLHSIEPLIDLIEHPRAPALWRHDRDVSNQTMVMLPIFQGWLNMFTEKISTSKRNLNIMKICQFKEKGLKTVGRYIYL